MGRYSKLWNPAFILLAISNFLSWLSYNMVAPVITSYRTTVDWTVGNKCVIYNDEWGI